MVSVGILSLFASLIGVIEPSIYDKVISSDIMPGVLSQDLVTIVVSIIIIGLAFHIKEKDYKKQVLILGIVGYFFYAYGIYVIEQVYTVLYYIYIAIFGLSSYSIVYTLISMREEMIENVQLPKPIRTASVAYSLFVAVIFTALWIASLLPLIQAGDRIDYLYSIYILDLCFIMPAYAIIGVQTAKKKKSGLLLMPALFILGAPLIGSLALGEALKPLIYERAMEIGLFEINTILSVIFFILAALYLWKFEIEYRKN